MKGGAQACLLVQCGCALSLHLRYFEPFIEHFADLHAARKPGHGRLQAFGYYCQEVGPFGTLCTPKEPP